MKAIRPIAFCLFALLSLNGFGQNPDGFTSMCEGMYSWTVPLAQPEQLNFEMKRDSNLVILDAREQSEYDISHIDNAICVGYDDFSLDSVNGIPKDAKIFVYCSIGYRSERVGEQLQDAGYQYVYNVYGGIFNWINNSYLVYDQEGNLTATMHGFDESWSKWLNGERCVPVTK